MAGEPEVTVADAVEAPSTERVKVPLAMPVPVSGTVSGELESELVTVRVPGRAPVVVGVKVTVTVQLPPGFSVLTAQGTVTA